MRIVLVTTGSRPALLEQTLRSMQTNAADFSRHHVMVVYDGDRDAYEELIRRVPLVDGHHIGLTGRLSGVGAAKNAGARFFAKGAGDGEPTDHDILMFSDDDMWYGPGWDTRLETAMQRQPARGMFGQEHKDVTQLGGWRHPFHQIKWPDDYIADIIDVTGRATMGRLLATDAVTGNCFVIRWSDWLRYGPFDSNAVGPGQSEDYALSQRIRAGGGLVATLDPPVAIHCGLVNSIGEPATGWRECEQQITEQLAGLSAEMRESVLIMRPAPTAEPKTSWNSELYSTYGKLRVGPDTKLPDGRTVAEAGLEPGPIVASRYAPGSFSRQFIEDADRAFEQARKELDMQPRNAPRQLIAGLNLCSGQRRFDPALGWANLDGQRVPPDRVPDIVWQADEPLPFGDTTMSYVAIVHALEHFGCGESVPLLRECHRVLRPGGSLIIIVPDMKRLAARWLSGEISEYIFNVNCYGAYISDERDRHRWSMSRESLPNLLGEAGTWSKIGEFDYREIAGSDFPRDWWMLAMEAVK